MEIGTSCNRSSTRRAVTITSPSESPVSAAPPVCAYVGKDTNKAPSAVNLSLPQCLKLIPPPFPVWFKSHPAQLVVSGIIQTGSPGRVDHDGGEGLFNDGRPHHGMTRLQIRASENRRHLITCTQIRPAGPGGFRRYHRRTEPPLHLGRRRLYVGYEPHPCDLRQLALTHVPELLLMTGVES